MNPSVLPRYLVGRRSAILEIAASPGAIACGILFALSAGFAREYDGEDLLHEPWHVLRPLGASLLSGTVLFLLIHGISLLRSRGVEERPPKFWSAYRVFMGLFWMTAPMAWLYGIPYERMLSPVAAVEANLWTLALVAAWRVILITRVISVIYGARPAPVFFIVMLFADAVVFAAMTTIPAPVIDVMGGIRHSERDALVAGVTFMVTILVVITAPVWIAGALVATATIKPTWAGFAATAPPTRGKGLLFVAVASIVIWIPALAVSQPEQVNRRAVETLMRSGRVAEAFEAISSRRPEDYPPHWDPPPRLGLGETEPNLEAITQAMRARWPADWIADAYMDKIRRRLMRRVSPFRSEDDWPRIAGFFEDYGQPDARASGTAETIDFLLEFDDTLSPADRAALERIRQLLASPE